MFHFRVRSSKWNRETRSQTLNIVAAVLGARSEHVPQRCEWNTREIHQRGNCPLIRPIIGTLFITGILSSKPPWFHSVHHRSLCIQYHSSNTFKYSSPDVKGCAETYCYGFYCECARSTSAFPFNCPNKALRIALWLIIGMLAWLFTLWVFEEALCPLLQSIRLMQKHLLQQFTE